MPKEVYCPHCGDKVATKPIKSWQFRNYDVSRYICGKCQGKFNVYKGPKSTFTIAK